MTLIKKRIAFLAILLCLLLGLVWRILPHSFSDIIPEDIDTIHQLSCVAAMIGIAEGNPDLISYSMPPLSSDNESFDEIMEILNSGTYQQDFRNLPPWPIHTAGGDGSACSVLLSFS